MPRKPRFYLPDMPAHVMQRGHNRSPVFFEDEDYRVYLRILKNMSDKYQCHIHGYVLMTNHIHLLVTPLVENAISRLFQGMGRQYVTYINKTYNMSGTLWEGRHKGSSIDTQHYFLKCMRYIELNPVRAGMCDNPSEYKWSSYAANALGESNAIVTPHIEFTQLGKTSGLRHKNYRALFNDALGEVLESEFENCVESGTPFGNKRFKQQIEAVLKCKVGLSVRGRPLVKRA